MTQSNSTFELTEEQIQFFKQNGFLVIKDFVPKPFIKQIHERIHEIIEKDFDLEKQVSLFSTEPERQKSLKDDYFLKSSENISFFLEDKAFDPETRKMKPGFSKHSAINKIGHKLELDPVFHKLCCHRKIEQIAKQLMSYKTPQICQTMYIFKPAKIGGEVGPHQDSSFLMTKNGTPVLGIWFAFENATSENGCLWGWPGSQDFPRVYHWVREPQEEGAAVPTLKFKYTGELDNKELDMKANEEKYKCLEVPAGSIVLFPGNFIHKSYKNTSNESREAMTIHLFDKEDGWSEEGWLQRESFETNWHEEAWE